MDLPRPGAPSSQSRRPEGRPERRDERGGGRTLHLRLYLVVTGGRTEGVKILVDVLQVLLSDLSEDRHTTTA